MELIDLYRQGRLTPEHYIPNWVQRRIAAIHDPRPSDWAMTELRELAAARLPYESRLPQYRALLGLEGEELPGGLVGITQAKVDADPAREADYWDAMWALRRIADSDERYQYLLGCAAEWEEQAQRYQAAGWPREWPFAYCDIWEAAGGTPATASAWASAGWSASEVLSCHITRRGHAVPFSSRLRETHPVRRDEISVWGDSNYAREEWLAPIRQGN